YIEILIEKGKANKALAVFIENENIISEYESGYFYFELGTKIIACGAENPKIIWNKILSILEGAMKIRMAAHSYHKELLAAAELSGDTRFFKKLQKFLDSYGIIENKQITEKTE
ncbi:MAG: hypothetical protein K2K57_05960, partial [Oscillospiraceae bacterium]|nr:hypothetical protein [Oscillospiraceae bacterium]